MGKKIEISLSNFANKDKAKNEVLQKIMENKAKSLDEINKRINEMPNITVDVPASLILAYNEARNAYGFYLFRSAMYNLISILEYILKLKLKDFIAEKEKSSNKKIFISLSELLTEANKSKFITNIEYKFFQGLVFIRNENAHELSFPEESEVILAFDYLYKIIRRYFKQ